MCPLCNTGIFILGILVTLIVFKYKWIIRKIKSLFNG